MVSTLLAAVEFGTSRVLSFWQVHVQISLSFLCLLRLKLLPPACTVCMYRVSLPKGRGTAAESCCSASRSW